MRLGNGFDVHRLVEGRKLILCGVDVSYHLGLLGHSDADVAIHALCDAILGALAQGDIGQLFPDNDPHYQNINSLILLREVVDLMQQRGYQIANVDLTIIAERPKLAPYNLLFRESLANALHCDTDQVSVKATTTEGLGFTGRGEGIACQASALLTLRN